MEDNKNSISPKTSCEECVNSIITKRTELMNSIHEINSILHDYYKSVLSALTSAHATVKKLEVFLSNRYILPQRAQDFVEGKFEERLGELSGEIVEMYNRINSSFNDTLFNVFVENCAHPITKDEKELILETFLMFGDFLNVCESGVPCTEEEKEKMVNILTKNFFREIEMPLPNFNI